jgi:single-stranded-DNA-specific exonuclease
MFRVVRQRMVGGRHLRLVVEPMDGQSRLEAIAFNQPELESRNAEVRMLYRLDVNEYRGERNLQLVVEQIEAVTDSGLQGAMVKCAETPVDDS